MIKMNFIGIVNSPRGRYGGNHMLRKKATRLLMTACVFLSFVTVSLFAQGVPRQDYTGLDKYLGQGRIEDASFVGVRAAEFLTIPVGARAIAMGSAYSAVADDISIVRPASLYTFTTAFASTALSPPSIMSS